MKREEEKLREMLVDYARAENLLGDARGDHLRDEDFIRLIETKPPEEKAEEAKANIRTENNETAPADELASLRRHLAGCDVCLAQFRDFYAFFASPEKGETIAGKNEIDAAWQAFAPLIIVEKETGQKEKKQNLNFWARLFPTKGKTNYAAAFGWAFAALLLLVSGISVFIAWQARNEKTQLAAELENQKQTFEERLKTLEGAAQNRDLAEQEKNRLAEEKDDLRQQIARLQTEIERAKQEKPEREKTVSPAVAPPVVNEPVRDNSLVAVNTPIYDVFPADTVVRSGGNDQPPNKLAVPGAAKTIVLILNAAGRPDFPVYRAELFNSANKIIWRGSGLRKDNLGNFTLTLSRATLKAGNYRLKLFGGGGGSSNIVAEYPVTIETK